MYDNYGLKLYSTRDTGEFTRSFYISSINEGKSFLLCISVDRSVGGCFCFRYFNICSYGCSNVSCNQTGASGAYSFISCINFTPRWYVIIPVLTLISE